MQVVSDPALLTFGDFEEGGFELFFLLDFPTQVGGAILDSSFQFPVRSAQAGKGGDHGEVKRE
jgi:hypothetical protein